MLQCFPSNFQASIGPIYQPVVSFGLVNLVVAMQLIPLVDLRLKYNI